MEICESLLKSIVDLGEIEFSEQEIIDFAKINDPLAFHTDVEVANNSRFNGLVCSGSQAFNFFYVNRWIPKYGNSVIAGLAVNNWNFLAPIYANDRVKANCTLESYKETKKEGEAVVKWGFNFNVDKKKVQELELTVLMSFDLVEDRI